MNKTVTLRRSGMTLIEIMISILILSVGLLGVLAAVPFGAMQMGKMVEKDFVTNTATNAHNIIAVNGWNQPTYWCNQKSNNDTNTTFFRYPSLSNDVVKQNFTLPVLLDPLGYIDVNGTSAFPFDYGTVGVDENYIPVYGTDYHQRIDRVFPSCPFVALNAPGNSYNPNNSQTPVIKYNNYYAKQIDRLFRSVDDIVYEREDNSTNRPKMLENPDNPNQTAFTGEYSWMAMITPSAAGVGNDFANLRFPADDPDVTVDVKTDVVVFRGRVPGDENDFIVANATVQGSGYAGGAVLLEKTAAISEDDAPVYAAALSENLKSSTHLLLVGPSDGAVDSGNSYNDRPYTACWYKIANFSDSDLQNGIPATLIGKSCPSCWTKKDPVGDPMEQAIFVRAVVFKNVRGISTKTTRLSAD